MKRLVLLPVISVGFTVGFAWGLADDLVGWVFLRNRRP